MKDVGKASLKAKYAVTSLGYRYSKSSLRSNFVTIV